MASSKRITKELAELSSSPLPGISVATGDENLYHWTATIDGPPDTPYQGGKFRMTIEFPVEYPFKGPRVRFVTKLYHPNVDDDGNMCVGLLKSEAWKPSTKASTVLQSIQSLLAEPNPDDALVSSIAEVYNQDRAQYNKTAAEWTKKHASE